MATQPFWGRLVRALTLLIVAANAHLWLVRAPQEILPQQETATIAHAGIAPAALGRPQSTIANASGAVSRNENDRVTVVTKLLSVGRGGGQPVGTSGFVRAAAAPARAEAREPIAKTAARVDPAAATPDAGAVTSERATPPPPEATRINEPAAPASPLVLTSLAATNTLPANVPPPAAPAPRPVSTTAAARAVRTPPVVEPDQKQLVLRVLNEYAAAYERLDVAAAKAVWPSVNDAALRRAFNQLEEQNVKFQSCGVTISGRDANAHCLGEASYRPRVGPRTLQRAAREWTFDLSKANEAWRITKATVR